MANRTARVLPQDPYAGYLPVSIIDRDKAEIRNKKRR